MSAQAAADAGQRMVARQDWTTIGNLAELGAHECYGRRLGGHGDPLLDTVECPNAVAWLADHGGLPPQGADGAASYSAGYVNAWLDAVDATAQLAAPSRAACRRPRPDLDG